MRNVINSLKAELYQLLHSKYLWGIISIPLLGIILATSYYPFSSRTNAHKVSDFISIVALILPLIISLTIAALCYNEQEAGGYQRLLCAPWSPVISHMSKLLVYFLAEFIAIFIGIMGYGLICRFLGNDFYTVGNYINAVCWLFIANIAWLIFQYVACLQFGKNLIIYLGIVSTIVNGLMNLSLGDGIWQYVMCAFGIRITKYTSELIYGTCYRAFIQHDMQKGIQSLIIQTLIMIIIFLIWSSHWQGTSKNGE